MGHAKVRRVAPIEYFPSIAFIAFCFCDLFVKDRQKFKFSLHISQHTRALFYKSKKEREVEITLMDRPTLSSPPKDFSQKEELSTSTTTQTTATRGVGEKFQSLSIDFFGNKRANEDDDGLTTTRNMKKKNTRSARGRMKRDGRTRSEWVSRRPRGAFSRV